MLIFSFGLLFHECVPLWAPPKRFVFCVGITILGNFHLSKDCSPNWRPLFQIGGRNGGYRFSSLGEAPKGKQKSNMRPKEESSAARENQKRQHEGRMSSQPSLHLRASPVSSVASPPLSVLSATSQCPQSLVSSVCTMPLQWPLFSSVYPMPLLGRLPSPRCPQCFLCLFSSLFSVPNATSQWPLVSSVSVFIIQGIEGP